MVSAIWAVNFSWICRRRAKISTTLPASACVSGNPSIYSVSKKALTAATSVKSPVKMLRPNRAAAWSQ